MDVVHKPQAELVKELSEAKKKVTIGTNYVHYKSADKIYKVTGLGFLESSDELCVIYESQYGEPITFLRPLSNWLDEIQWQGKTVNRFTKL